MGAVTRGTDETRRIGVLEAQVQELSAQMNTLGTQFVELRTQVTANAERSEDRHEVLMDAVKATQATTAESVRLLRERDQREAEAREREAEHRRTMERDAVKMQATQAENRAATVRAVAGHPAVVSILTAIAAAIGAWTYATWGGPVPGHTVTGQAAATGIMGAGVAPVAAPAE